MPLLYIMALIVAAQAAQQHAQSQAQAAIDYIPADEPLFDALEE